MSASLIFAILLAFYPATQASICWRNTTCTWPSTAAFPGPWETNIYAPASRTVFPLNILSPSLTPASLYPQEIPILNGNGTQVVFDFGKEVGGILSVDYFSKSAEGQLGFAFSEAKNFVGQVSDSSHGKENNPLDAGDGALFTSFSSGGEHTYTMPDKSLRGGFRYLTVFLITNATTEVQITNVTLEIGFQPTWSNLRAYQGYFHSNDELLNRIWYAGAYTLQTNAVPVNTGRWIPRLTQGWANNGTLGGGDTIIVDGAKRDRAVWPGDMGIAVPSAFVSTGDMDSIKNALQVMYDTQNLTTGEFPESGPPLKQLGSDTYHLWTMIGTYNYFLYANDEEFLARNWQQYVQAMNFSLAKIDDSGLFNVTDIRDWARWQQGGHNSEAQMIFYHTLSTGVELATWLQHLDLAKVWRTKASALAGAVNARCWDGEAGLFKDNDTTTSLHPQDANSMALLYGLVTGQRGQSISKGLTKNWSPIGPISPELPNNISPFISSFELQGHFTIGSTNRALELLRTTWGWILNNENSTQSTLLEGYLFNGSFAYRSDRGYGYDASYPSHSHGWSTGPTSALTNYILGLSITSPGGRSWSLKPQFGDLVSVEGGFVTALGNFKAGWERKEGGYVIWWRVPHGVAGEITLPCVRKGVFPRLKVDGKPVQIWEKRGATGGLVIKLTAAGEAVRFTTTQTSHVIEVN